MKFNGELGIYDVDEILNRPEEELLAAINLEHTTVIIDNKKGIVYSNITPKRKTANLDKTNRTLKSFFITHMPEFYNKYRLLIER